jgi:hypothetical protein
MGFQPSQAQGLYGVKALRRRTRQPVLGIARLLMKRVAGDDFLHEFIVTRPGEDEAVGRRPREG